MSEHRTHLEWTATEAAFTYDTYVRAHDLAFEGGQSIRASAAVEYRGDASRVNPEELLVASASSCHMMTFLAIAARRRFVVKRYVDDATGFLEPGEDKRLAITRIELRPVITWENAAPDAAEIAKLHDLSHRNCFIASSIRASVTVIPTDPIVG